MNPAPDVRGAEIGRCIRSLRDERGLKQTYLASKAGISREELSRIERGHRVPMTQTLRALSAALEVSLMDLLGEEDEL